MAVTDPEKGARGCISCFLVDTNSKGFSIASRHDTMMGDRPSELLLVGRRRSRRHSDDRDHDLVPHRASDHLFRDR
jgi:hypothetical protein